MPIYSVTALINLLTSQLLSLYKSPNNTQIHAWWILEFITHKTQAQLLTQQTLTLSQAEYDNLQEIVRKHVHEHMPLQYLFGFVPFLGLTLTIRPPILIPRPETEYWCSLLIEKLQKLSKHDFTILDLGTGSGCIALAFAKEFPDATIYAVDISSQACELAQENARNNSISNCIIIESDLFSNIPVNLTFDLIVSNPPYISHTEWLQLDPDVKKWEAYQALVAKNSGLSILKKIIKQARNYMSYRADFEKNNIPQIALEIGYSQAEAGKRLYMLYGYTHITSIHDLAGKDRLITANINS